MVVTFAFFFNDPQYSLCLLGTKHETQYLSVVVLGFSTWWRSRSAPTIRVFGVQPIPSLSDASRDHYSGFITLARTLRHSKTCLTLGKAMVANLPEQVMIIGIAASHIYEFGEEVSLPVARAVSQATQIVIDLL